MEEIKHTLELVKEEIEARIVPALLTKDEPRTLTSNRSGSSALKFECDLCSDVGMVYVSDGQSVPRVRRCECRQRRIVERALSAIPARFGCPRLESLAPRYDLHPDRDRARFIGDVQREAIEQMRAEPFESYLFCGDNDTGKSHLAYALYTNALFAGRRVIAVTVAELLEEFKRMELHEPTKTGESFIARVTPEMLRCGEDTRSEKWTLFIDEFEKARVTEFTCEMLFALVDAAWKYQHQLIVTSNMTVDELIARWSAKDDVYGRSIAKRIASNCIAVGFFQESVVN